MKRMIAAASATMALTVCAGVAPAIAADSWTGHYTGHVGSYHWEATITNRAAGVYDLRVSVASQMPACLGDVSGSAKLAGGKLSFDDEDCTLSISKRGTKGIRIEERQCNAHGAACTFSSVLRRTSAKSDPGEAAGASPAGGTVAAATYIGRWSEEPYTCRPDDTISLTRHEMHLLENGLCRFRKITGGSGRWHTTMICEGEGSTDRVSADLIVTGDFLNIVYGKPYNTTAKFKRCGPN